MGQPPGPAIREVTAGYLPALLQDDNTPKSTAVCWMRGVDHTRQGEDIHSSLDLGESWRDSYHESSPCW